jgi:8-oxo-dGTP pyrophosphatase MutT (NUDIX family)
MYNKINNNLKQFDDYNNSLSNDFYVNNKQFCNNCGKQGHIYNQCKVPITSIGIIAFRFNNDEIEYLMICRKNTLGFIDFMRGKYSIYNKEYIVNMMKQMTVDEKNKLISYSFNDLWSEIWGNEVISIQYKLEEGCSREKFNMLSSGIYNKNDFYNLHSLIIESNEYSNWIEPEWGFPKGRRNYQEKDYDCAVREFHEETGYIHAKLNKINNLLHFEEIFTGSNYKSYKHKYFLVFMNLNDTTKNENYSCSEVSKISWKNYQDCMNSIRDYNLEKKRLITNINTMLKCHKLVVN